MDRTRKNPRLKDYDYTRGNVVLATICVQDRRKILCTIHDPKTDCDAPVVELSEIGIITEKYTKTIPGIDKYVIMPNHVHMIVLNEPGESISKKIQSWKVLIGKEVGARIWQRSFYDHLIRDEQDYLIKWKYVDDNPQKWSSDRYFQK